MNGSIPVIILGGTGYVAGELLRLVLGHPSLTLAASVSSSQAGTEIARAFPHLAPAVGERPFSAIDDAMAMIDGGEQSLLLSAAPHGQSAAILGQAIDRARAAGTNLVVVDASADFRFADTEMFAAVYGQPHPRPDLVGDFCCAVPEHVAGNSAPHAAQPGCFATSMLLAIVPLIATGLCAPRFDVAAITGSTGAGRGFRPTTHHPERQSNLFAYAPLVHRHQPEVQALARAATGETLELGFVPHSGPFARGIHATLFGHLRSKATTDDVNGALATFYADAPLVQVTADLPTVKQVAGSCHARLSARVDGERVIATVVLDNLLKGAAGGCLQWANRLLGMPEETGLVQPAVGWI